MSTLHLLRCRLCGCLRGACDCPESPVCGNVAEPECTGHLLCWYCGEAANALTDSHACDSCEREAERTRPQMVLREARLGVAQLVDWLREYDRDSGGPVVGLQAWIPELGARVAAIVREIRAAATRLESVLAEPSVQSNSKGG